MLLLLQVAFSGFLWRKDFKRKQSYIRKTIFDETEIYWYIEATILRTEINTR